MDFKILLNLNAHFQSDTLNPFDTNGQINPTVMDENRRIDELSKESGQLTLMEDQRHELADLRRQVVYLQVGSNLSGRLKENYNTTKFFNNFYSRAKLTIVIEQFASRQIQSPNMSHIRYKTELLAQTRQQLPHSIPQIVPFQQTVRLEWVPVSKLSVQQHKLNEWVHRW